MFDELSTTQEEVCQLKALQSNDALLDPNEDDALLLEQLLQVKKDQELLKIECELLEGRLKRRIGSSAGIRGIATWKSQTKRMYNEKLFRDCAPERYQELLERYYCLDTQTWKKEKPDEYEQVQTTYFIPQTTRTFKIQQTD